jgi:hypothetical protein
MVVEQKYNSQAFAECFGLQGDFFKKGTRGLVTQKRNVQGGINMGNRGTRWGFAASVLWAVFCFCSAARGEIVTGTASLDNGFSGIVIEIANALGVPAPGTVLMFGLGLLFLKRRRR